MEIKTNALINIFIYFDVSAHALAIIRKILPEANF